MMGFKEVLLSIKLKRGKFDIEATVIEQGKIIKELNEVISELSEEKKELSEMIERLKGEESKETNNFEIVQIGFDHNNYQNGTYQSSFTDMGIKVGSLTMKKDGKVKLDLHLNGLWTNTSSGYNAMFRLEFTQTNTGAKKYFPSGNGWLQRCYNAGNYQIDFSLAFCDVVELSEGHYTVKLQWAYSSNSSSYYLYYYYNYGDIKLIATICYGKIGDNQKKDEKKEPKKGGKGGKGGY